MKYKALFLDLDGTTVPNASDSIPSQRITEAIAKAKNYLHVCIVTGRPLSHTQYILEHLELSGPCILDQGAQIYDPVKKEIIRELYLDPQLIPTIHNILQSIGEPVYIFDGEKGVLYDKARLPSSVMSMYVENTTLEKADHVIKKLGTLPRVAAHKMASWKGSGVSLDVTHASATKLHAIAEVARLLGVNTHEMIGVGDSYNDYPLLMACGVKVAMGNAVPELKAIADFIAPSVDEDGVATVIEKFILNN